MSAHFFKLNKVELPHDVAVAIIILVVLCTGGVAVRYMSACVLYCNQRTCVILSSCCFFWRNGDYSIVNAV